MGFGLGFEKSALIPSVCFSLLRGFNTTLTSSFVVRLTYNWNTVSNHLYLFFSPFLLQPHFEASVKMKLALPKVGAWSPSGLQKLWSSISGVKTPQLEVFFIPLESS